MSNYTTLRVSTREQLESACARIDWLLDQAGELDRAAMKRRVDAYLAQVRAENQRAAAARRET